MLNLGNYDVVAGMRLRPLPRALRRRSSSDGRFIDQGGQLAEAQNVFCERGGFCREHAWLFHRRAALALTGVPVAKMYEGLLRRDVTRLEQLELDLAAESRIANTQSTG
jgi:hypothetical protein